MSILFVLLGFLLQTPAQTAPPAPARANPVVVIDTTEGAITVELYKDRAPVSVDSFLRYAADGHYTGTIFHRVVSGYVIQGGGFTTELAEKATRPPIQNEATNGLRNLRGTIAMARLRALRSATSQFYINVVDNPALDHRGFSPADFGYAVFGRVIAGMDVVEKIAVVRTGVKGGMENLPVTPVVIKSVTVKP